MKKKLDKRRFGKDKIFREKRAIDKKKRRKKDEIKNEKEYSLATDQTQKKEKKIAVKEDIVGQKNQSID